MALACFLSLEASPSCNLALSLRTAFLVSRHCGKESGRTAIELFAITSDFMMDGYARNCLGMTRLGETSSM